MRFLLMTSLTYYFIKKKPVSDMNKENLSEKSFCIFSTLDQLFGSAPVCKAPCLVHVDFASITE